ncbi:MAG: hypothetical protein AB7F50_02490 [Fimbriimonadaceae bacterium]
MLSAFENFESRPVRSFALGIVLIVLGTSADASELVVEVMRGACREFGIGDPDRKFTTFPHPIDSGVLDVWAGAPGQEELVGSVTVLGHVLSIRGVGSSIGTHRARPRTGKNAWRDEADVGEFLLPFVRKYATAEEWDETARIAFEPSVPGENGKRGRVFVHFPRTTGGYPWLDRAVAATFWLDYESRSVLSASFPHDVVLAPTFHNEVLVTEEEVLRKAPEGSKARLGWYSVPYQSTTATARLVWTVRHPQSHMFVYDATTGERVDVSPVAMREMRKPDGTGRPKPTGPARVVRTPKEPEPSKEPAARPQEQNAKRPPGAAPWPWVAALAVAGAAIAAFTRQWAKLARTKP